MSVRRSQHRGLPRSHLLHLITLFLGLLALMGGAFAGSVNLAWDAVSGAAGYRVHYGTTSATYTANLDAGSKTTATVAGLTDGTTYYFAVKAYAGTVTSGYSNEVSTVANTAPVASFTANGSTASSISVTQGQTVTLLDTSTGTVESRSWNLGEGSSRPTSATVVQSYATTGTKTVTLSVTGAGVTHTASKAINVTAAAAAPVASFSASPISGTAPLAVKFTDASSGSVNTWSWNFGNGATSTSTAQSPTYTYASAGAYTVSLTVTGPGGSNTVTKTGYITVTASGGSIVGGGSGGTGVSTAGLVAAYGFDETSGIQVLDASGNGNHGTLTNVTRSTLAKVGRALSFNGLNSLVTVPDGASLDLTAGLTLSAWVYPTTSTSGWKTVILKERIGGLAYSLYANSDAALPNSTLSIGGIDRQLTVGSPLPSNTWTHLAATYDGATQRLYVNGVQVGSRAQTGTLDLSANPLRIGGNTVWANEYFQGLIDEVRVYNRALSQAEIAAVSQQPVTK